MRPQSLNYFFRPLTSIRGIGPKTKQNLIKLFKNKNLDEPVFKDLLCHLPYGLVQRVYQPNLLLTEDGTEVVTTVDVDKVEQKRIGGRAMFNILCSNKSGFVTLVYFAASKEFIDKNFVVDRQITVAGKLERYKDRTQIVHPDYVVKDEKDVPVSEPVYPLTAGVTNKFINKIIKNVLTEIPKPEEWCDAEFLKQNDLPAFDVALKKIHSPQSFEDFDINKNYRKRLAYDEILANQLALAISRRTLTKQKGVNIKTKHEYIKQLLDVLSFKLTEGQRSILKEILADFKSENRMFRLLQGDVGSGKTIVAIAAMMEAVEAGFQAGFMLPTEILAKQQFATIQKILDNDFFIKNDVRACLLIGSIKPAEKQKLYQEIREGKYKIVVGTHALFQEAVSFKNLAFIAIDEQHRFGVKQRMELTNKGDKTHVLLMSATPIPRTLAMTIYGDLEVSSLTEKPAGRLKIDTRLVADNRVDEVIDGINRAIKDDNRVYWVCPLIKGMGGIAAEEENASAENRYKNLKKIFGDKVALVHGQMKTKDKDSAMKRFKNGDAKILVATTVIEVGVDVPEATIIVIEQAEKFGLAQLHQLRGRVGRSDRKSSCILLYGSKLGENGRNRLKVLRETDDGFRIAEEDLAMRGSGDLIGLKQSGFPDFYFAFLPEHKDLLFAARDDVKIILNKDHDLKSQRGQRLKSLLYFFEYDKQIKNLEA